MIKRSAGYPVELKEKMRGGEGVVTSEEFLTPAELYDKGRLYGKLTLPPGASIGLHVHEGEMESFFVISGKAEYLDDSESTALLDYSFLLVKNVPFRAHPRMTQMSRWHF